MTSKLKEINFNDLPGEIKLKIYNINKEHKYDNWIDIKKKSIKQTLIEKFVCEFLVCL